MTEVNWDKPLVAVHPDGRRVEVFLTKTDYTSPAAGVRRIEPAPERGVAWFDESGKHAFGLYWRIENRTAAYPEGMTPELAARMVALLRTYTPYRAPWFDEARAIMAELEAVDPLVCAVEEALDWWDNHTSEPDPVGTVVEILRKAGATITEAKQ